MIPIFFLRIFLYLNKKRVSPLNGDAREKSGSTMPFSLILFIDNLNSTDNVVKKDHSTGKMAWDKSS